MWQRVQGIGEAFGLGRNGVPPGPVGQFDTDWVREPDRADYYREMLRGLVCPATPERMTAGEQPFRVRARNGASGDLLYADYAATPHRFERGAAEVSHGPTGCYYVLRQQRATAGHVQVRGEAVRLAPGECVLGDSDTPLAVCEDSALAFSLVGAGLIVLLSLSGAVVYCRTMTPTPLAVRRARTLTRQVLGPPA